jgi:hypothetical protein
VLPEVESSGAENGPLSVESLSLVERRPEKGPRRSRGGAVAQIHAETKSGP